MNGLMMAVNKTKAVTRPTVYCVRLPHLHKTELEWVTLRLYVNSYLVKVCS